MSVVESGELEGLETVARVRLSGQVVPGVGTCEYFLTIEEALVRRSAILDNAPKALLEIADCECVLDEHGEVLAELEQ